MDLPGEEWRPVVGHVGYEVSNLGRVRSWRKPGKPGRAVTPRIRKQVPLKARGGYLTVMFVDEGKRILRYVHHLVLEAFLGPRPPDTETRNKDRDVTNNRLDNLAWGTWNENYNDKIVHGTSQHGERNPQAKLTNEQAAEIRASKEPLKVLASRFGVRESTISRIRNGVRRAEL